MRSVCGGLDYNKDSESHLTALGSNILCSTHISCTGSEDADGDDDSSGGGGYIHPYLNEESNDKSSDADDECQEDKKLATPESSSAVTFIPAIKGSREKHGSKPLEKLRVSWAEDVYDPPPSLVSHTRSKIQKPHKSKSRDSLKKKNGKKGQKGSSSSKDKKSSSSSSRNKHSRDNKFGWATQTSIVAASS